MFYFTSFYGFWVVMLIKHIPFVVGEYKSGEWQGYDESDEAQQAAPYWKSEEDHCWIQSCDFAHYARCEHPILYGLYNAEHYDGSQNDRPEVGVCVMRLKYG